MEGHGFIYAPMYLLLQFFPHNNGDFVDIWFVTADFLEAIVNPPLNWLFFISSNLNWNFPHCQVVSCCWRSVIIVWFKASNFQHDFLDVGLIICALIVQLVLWARFSRLCYFSASSGSNFLLLLFDTSIFGCKLVRVFSRFSLAKRAADFFFLCFFLNNIIKSPK